MSSAIEVLKNIKNHISCDTNLHGFDLPEPADYYPIFDKELDNALSEALLALKQKENDKIVIKKEFDNFWNENKKSNWSKEYDAGFSNGYQLACADLKELLQKLNLYPKKEKELEEGDSK